MNFENWFHANHPQIPVKSALAVLQLAGEGSTVPFIARYRKEHTGNLNEVAIQAALDGKETWDQIIKRQTFILEEIERQKKLTPELKERLAATFDLTTLEDLYLPFKQKRKTKAALAKEAGLEPLADWIWQCGHGEETPQPGQTLDIWAETYKNPEKNVPDGTSAILGAQDILIERIAEALELRELVRKTVFEKGFVKSKKGQSAKLNSKFEKYFDYQEGIPALLRPENSHRTLAIRRGFVEKELQMTIGPAVDEGGYEENLLKTFEQHALKIEDFSGAQCLLAAARLAFKAHVLPSIENEVNKELKAVADVTSIKVFSENVRKLLLASPYGSKAVLGVDPGIRTGCKLAVVDGSGKYIANTVMKLQTDEEKVRAKTIIVEAVKNSSITAIAVGNGTAGREAESFIRATLSETGLAIPVVMVSESGASVYSASDVAREEFPDLDLTVRGAISIARRLQDPLAELVKVDPKSIGVGQYQHDVSQSQLKKSLELVVDSCVNSVGVNLNTASYHLLAHVSGVGPTLAKAIVEHRATKGLFSSRKDLLTISRFSEKVFEQAAGFLRIPSAQNPLDNTGVHPERYALIEEFAASLQKNVADLLGPGVTLVKGSQELKEKAGVFTFNDIVAELEKPGRDPREHFVPFSFRDDIHELKDLKPGMPCPGIVTNVTNFGAFVDIGVHQDGLVHISQLANRFIKDPREFVSPGDRVNVRVVEVNLDKKQIALTMRQEEVRRPPSEPSPARTVRDGQDRQGEQRRRDHREARPNPDRRGPDERRPDQRSQQRPDRIGDGRPPHPNAKPQRRDERRPQRQTQPFNNPFAVLAGKFPRK